MKYGAILQATRQRAGLTQEDMADEMHIDQGCISRYENDRKKMELSDFIRWMQATQAHEVAVAFLLGVDGIGLMQQVMDVVSNGIIGTLIGGITCLF